MNCLCFNCAIKVAEFVITMPTTVYMEYFYDSRNMADWKTRQRRAEMI